MSLSFNANDRLVDVSTEGLGSQIVYGSRPQQPGLTGTAAGRFSSFGLGPSCVRAP
jgi:hypothetical protein